MWYKTSWVDPIGAKQNFHGNNQTLCMSGTENTAYLPSEHMCSTAQALASLAASSWSHAMSFSIRVK